MVCIELGRSLLTLNGCWICRGGLDLAFDVDGFRVVVSLHPPKINKEPENDGLEDEFPLPGGPYSQVPAVNLPGCRHWMDAVSVEFSTSIEIFRDLSQGWGH